MSIYLLSRCVPLVSTYGHVFLCPLSHYYKIPSSLIFLSSFNAIPFILFIHIQAFATSPSFSESINLHNHALSVVNQNLGTKSKPRRYVALSPSFLNHHHDDHHYCVLHLLLLPLFLLLLFPSTFELPTI